MSDPHLTYFKDHEFIRGGIQWRPMIATDLLVMTDVLRHMRGQPIWISPHDRAIGRRDGESKSSHNIEYHGLVLAMDIFADGVETQRDAIDFFRLARDIGFTEFGFYPDWTDGNGNKRFGFHIGRRRSRRPGSPATWGFLRDGGALVQVSLENAFDAVA